MQKKEYCYLCGGEIPKGEKVNWLTKNGLLVICATCDETFDEKEFAKLMKLMKLEV